MYLYRCSFFAGRDPSLFLANQLQPLSLEEREQWLQNITGHIQNQGLSTPNVEQMHLELAIKARI